MTQTAYMTIPKQLLTDPRYQKLNADAILLYSSLVDRLKLSMKNGKAWVDKKGDTFIYYTRKAMCAILKRSEPYIRKLLNLLKECGLLVERRQGLTKPNILFPVLLEPDVLSSDKQCIAPERNKCSRSNPEPRKIEYKDDKSTYRWQKKDDKKAITIHNYTQREYPEGYLASFAEKI